MEEKIAQWKRRPVSWSQISSFEYDPEQWFKRYFLGEESTSPELEFGKKVGKLLETDPTFLPQIKRQSKMEHEFKCEFKGMELIGYADSFCTITNKKMEEYKSGVKLWDQKRVDEHGQITQYALMHFVMTKIPPEELEITLWWMPTKREESGDFKVKISFIEPIEKNIKMFHTKRTMRDVLIFGERINKTRKEMEKYAKTHLQFSKDV